MRGALELVSVVSQAQRKKWFDARERLAQKAVPLGKRAGESNTMWTVFGPVNIDLHALSIELLAGESAEGLRLADEPWPGRGGGRPRRRSGGRPVGQRQRTA
ncbi:hypothetical protein GCM10009716_38590 [Streptomyces sodiiphilus]|uniref:Uncharacterized protein n=1 Tax=Streptomyces sodiiphilus TaxID=226217 RepID=A0ABN2PNJ4_9ACTN